VVATTYNTALQQCWLPVDPQAFVNLITFGETKTTFKARPHCSKPRTLWATLKDNINNIDDSIKNINWTDFTCDFL
jgi:hypothetical protein